MSNILLRKLALQTRITTATGVFVGLVDGLARVNVQGATVDLRCDGWYPPLPGMPVRVETVNGVMRVMGPSQTLGPRGTVAAVGSGSTTVTVSVDGVLYSMPVLAGYSPTIGDQVVINWTSGHVLGEEAEPPVVETPVSEPAPSRSSFSRLTVYPRASGKWDYNYSNWWGGSEVWASNNNDGIWVYGGRFSTLKGATITRVEIYLPLITELGSCSIGLHSHSSIPAGAPSISSLTVLSDRGGWVRLPTSWGATLRDNPSFGIGVKAPTGGLNKWRGVGQDSQSGVLRFAGSR